MWAPRKDPGASHIGHPAGRVGFAAEVRVGIVHALVMFFLVRIVIGPVLGVAHIPEISMNFSRSSSVFRARNSLRSSSVMM